MLETYYICTDKKSYKYALQYYKNEKTGILYCLTDEDFAQINELYNTSPNRNFYFFSSCAKGYLKANVNAIENFTDDYCELYAIPTYLTRTRFLQLTTSPKKYTLPTPKTATKSLPDYI